MSVQTVELMGRMRKWYRGRIDETAEAVAERYRATGRFLRPDGEGNRSFGLGAFLGANADDVQVWHLFAAGSDDPAVREAASSIEYEAHKTSAWAYDPDSLDTILRRYVVVLAALNVAKELDARDLPGVRFLRETGVVDLDDMRHVRSVAKVVKVSLDDVLQANWPPKKEIDRRAVGYRSLQKGACPMAITINVGGSKKVSQNYDSQGVSLNVTAEVPNDAVAEPQMIADKASNLFDLVNRLLDEQLAKLGQAGGKPSNGSTHTLGIPGRGYGNDRGRYQGNGRSNGNGHTSGGNDRRLTQAQGRAIGTMTWRLNEDADAWVHHEFGVSRVADLTVRQASEFIDTLKAAIQDRQPEEARR